MHEDCSGSFHEILISLNCAERLPKTTVPALNKTGEAYHYSFENVEWRRNNVLAQTKGYTRDFDV